MGKNQAYKAMQRARVASSSANYEEVPDGMVDGSFHSPEWQAAHLASLRTSHTITWEEFKRKKKEDEMRKGEIEADKDRMMREYRAQLDAERASKLATGRNHHHHSISTHKKDKEKHLQKHERKNKKHSKRRACSTASNVSSSEEGDDEDSRSESRRSKPKRSKARKKSKNKHTSSSEEEDSSGPVPLSRFFGSKN